MSNLGAKNGHVGWNGLRTVRTCYKLQDPDFVCNYEHCMRKESVSGKMLNHF